MASVTILFLTSFFIFTSQSEICSLYYTYSTVSKSLISEFHHSVEINDIEMSFCKSVNKADFLTQLCEETKSLFRNETDDLNYKREWLQININALMEAGNENVTNDTDLHVLQWRHGCAVERHSNGSIIFLQGTDEYAYDGETLTFNLSVHWKPLVLEHGIIWDRESVSSLERKCVETLTIFSDLQREGKIITASHPEVYSSVKVSGSSEQQILVCLATGFYPKHVQMEIRRDQTPVPEEQLNSHGLRPNTDGSFQLMKSLQILPSGRSHYQCVVKHQTLTEPLISSWGNDNEEDDKDESNVLLPVIIGVVVALVILAIIVLVFYLLRKYVKYRKSLERQSQDDQILKCLHTLSQDDLILAPRRSCGHSSQYSCYQSYNFPSSRNFVTTQTELEFLEGPDIQADLAAVFNDSSHDENSSDDSLEDVQTEELQETQSLCDAKETPAGAPTAARGAMGSKNTSMPNFAMEREDTDQNTVTQNALLLPLPRRCRSKNISMPNLTLERKDSDASS